MKQLVKRTLQGKPAQNRTIEIKFARFLLDVVKGRRQPGEVFPLMCDDIWCLGRGEDKFLRFSEMALVWKENGAHHLSSVLSMEMDGLFTIEQCGLINELNSPQNTLISVKINTHTEPVKRVKVIDIVDGEFVPVGIGAKKASGSCYASFRLELENMSFEEFERRLEQYLGVVRKAGMVLGSLKEEILPGDSSKVIQFCPNEEEAG